MENLIDELEQDERYYANKRLEKQIERDIEMFTDLGCLFNNTSRC